MEITEDLLYAEIGRAVVTARVLRNQLTAVTTENRRLEQRVASLAATLDAEPPQEPDGG